MATVTTILLLLFLVLCSSLMASALRAPLPLLQIGLGAIVGLATGIDIELTPETFFLLFLPPLLYLDGWRISKAGLYQDRWVILTMATGLVLFTVLGVGYFIHWLIPAMPLAVAFALAGVLSPTDPVAVKGIATHTPVPHRMMQILEGEALLNDASGLVCLQLGVLAVVTGTFSSHQAILSFLRLALGGLAVGYVLTRLIVAVKSWKAKHFGEEAGPQIVISLLIPFAAYLVSEQLGVSGILASVAAGVTMSQAEILGLAQGKTRLQRKIVWDAVQYAANGAIFVLLGWWLPRVLATAPAITQEVGLRSVWWLILDTIAISLALAVLRYLWVWTTVQIHRLRANLHHAVVEQTPWQLITAFSIAGVRGAVTLAGVQTLPFMVRDGVPFPTRDLAIFLAAGVILLSLIVSSMGMPTLLKGLHLPPEPTHDDEESRARVMAAEAAIRALEKAHHQMAKGRCDADCYAEAASDLMADYRDRIDWESPGEERHNRKQLKQSIDRRLRAEAMKAERETIFFLARTRQIDDQLARKLISEVDLNEARDLPFWESESPSPTA